MPAYREKQIFLKVCRARVWKFIRRTRSAGKKKQTTSPEALPARRPYLTMKSTENSIIIRRTQRRPDFARKQRGTALDFIKTARTAPLPRRRRRTGLLRGKSFDTDKRDTLFIDEAADSKTTI